MSVHVFRKVVHVSRVNSDVCGTETDVQSESKTGIEALFFSAWMTECYRSRD